MSDSMGHVFSFKEDALRIGIYFHGDEQFAEGFRHDMNKRDDTAKAMTRAIKFYAGEVESFNEVYITPNAQRFCPDESSLLIEAYQKRKIPVHLMKENTEKREPAKTEPVVEQPAEQPADAPRKPGRPRNVPPTGEAS